MRLWNNYVLSHPITRWLPAFLMHQSWVTGMVGVYNRRWAISSTMLSSILMNTRPLRCMSRLHRIMPTSAYTIWERASHQMRLASSSVLTRALRERTGARVLVWVSLSPNRLSRHMVDRCVLSHIRRRQPAKVHVEQRSRLTYHCNNTHVPNFTDSVHPFML